MIATSKGRACLRFVQEGAKIVIADINREEGERTEAEIKGQGGEAIFIRTDTGSAADNDAIARLIAGDSYTFITSCTSSSAASITS